MPRVPRFKIAAVAELFRQMEYAPAETRHRQMEATEALVEMIDPALNYPEEFITYRVTGYRPDRGEEPVTFVGEALLPDLVNLVQLLSATLDLPPERGGQPAVPLEEIPARLNISLKTVQRYRKQGLLCHYITHGNGAKKLACYTQVLEQFAQKHKARIAKAAAFTRVGEDAEERIIEQARLLRNSLALSLHETATQLSGQFGRARETIRMMLRRHDRTAAQPIFTSRGPLTDREEQIIWRAWRRGVKPGEIARRFGRTRPAIHRAVNRVRIAMLRSVELTFIHLPTFDLPDAAQVVLAAPSANAGLRDCLPDEDALRLLQAVNAAKPLDERTEDGLLAAYNLLKMQFGSAIAQVQDTPDSEMLDQVETKLRWAGMLKRRLCSMGLPTAIRRIDHHLNRPLLEQPVERIVEMIRLATDVAQRTVEGIDPSRGQRLERMCAFAMDRELAQRDLSRIGGRAAARHSARSIPLDELMEAFLPWETWLIPGRAMLKHTADLPSPMREAISLRYGVDGSPPRTIAEVAGQLGMSQIATLRLVQRGEAELRRKAAGNR
jgi:RNA polymerase primary sigma factor